MNNTEIIDQLRCLKEFCQAQIQPGANRMWTQDVEALTAVIERLEWHDATKKAGEKIKMPSGSTANEEVFHALAMEEVPEYHIAKVSPCDCLNQPTNSMLEVHAHWELVNKYGMKRCSHCKCCDNPYYDRFCGNCGAIMDEEGSL